MSTTRRTLFAAFAALSFALLPGQVRAQVHEASADGAATFGEEFPHGVTFWTRREPVGCWFCDSPDPTGLIAVELGAGRTATYSRGQVRLDVGYLDRQPETPLGRAAGGHLRAVPPPRSGAHCPPGPECVRVPPRSALRAIRQRLRPAPGLRRHEPVGRPIRAVETQPLFDPYWRTPAVHELSRPPQVPGGRGAHRDQARFES